MDNVRDHLERCYKNFVVAYHCNELGACEDCLCVTCMNILDIFTLTDLEVERLLENLGL